MKPRHFLDLEDIESTELRSIIEQANRFKAHFQRGHPDQPSGPFLKNRYVAMILEWPATRTKLHCEVATGDLGGTALTFYGRDMPTARGESIGDTARILSRHCDLILYRTGDHTRLLEMSRNATCPVINGMTDYSHPFRILVEIMTFEENRGTIAGKNVAFLGDCRQNQAFSWIHGSVKFGFHLTMACPPELSPRASALEWAERHERPVRITRSPEEAVQDADYVCTDIWYPMGHEDRERRRNLLSPFQVNTRLMSLARSQALFMHPLAANRGEEVTDDVIDGPQSVVWQGGIENKRHLLKSIFMWQFHMM